MLTFIKRSKKAFRRLNALLVFISCVTFHTLVSADIKEETAEQYRAAGYAEQQKGNLNEALSYYTKAATLGPANAVLLNDMGVLYEDIDLYSRAEENYLKAIQADARYLPPYNNLAYLYQRRGDMKKAAEYFKQRFERGDPGDPWAEKAKDELIRIDPRYRDWVTSLEADALNKKLEAKSREEFYENVKRSQEHYSRGEDLFKEGSYDEAMKEYDKAIMLSPKSPKILEARERVILEKAKKSVREQSAQAIKRLEVGDTVSARHEIEQILTTIPKEPIMISR